MSSTTSTRWLHEPVSNFLGRYATKSAVPLTHLKVQIFITHRQHRVLLFQDRGKDTWTARSEVVTASESRSLCQIALEMLQNAIEERTLPDLQFLDHVVQKPQLEVHPAAPSRPLIKILLSTANPRIEEMPTINREDEFVGFQWFDLTSPDAEIAFRNVPKHRFGQIFQLMVYWQHELGRLHQTGGQELRVLYYYTIKTAIAIKSIDLGEKVTYAFVAVSAANPDVLCLFQTTAAKVSEALNQNHRQIENQVAVSGGGFETEKYTVAGLVSEDKIMMSEVYVTPEMLLPGGKDGA